MRLWQWALLALLALFLSALFCGSFSLVVLDLVSAETAIDITPFFSWGVTASARITTNINSRKNKFKASLFVQSYIMNRPIATVFAGTSLWQPLTLLNRVSGQIKQFFTSVRTVPFTTQDAHHPKLGISGATKNSSIHAWHLIVTLTAKNSSEEKSQVNS